jgi:hypothetical protein
MTIPIKHNNNSNSNSEQNRDPPIEIPILRILSLMKNCSKWDRIINNVKKNYFNEIKKIKKKLKIKKFREI